MKKNVHKISKFLSLLLRHRPEVINLELDDSGWANVEELLLKSRQKGYEFDLAMLKEVVKTNDK